MGLGPGDDLARLGLTQRGRGVDELDHLDDTLLEAFLGYPLGFDCGLLGRAGGQEPFASGESLLVGVTDLQPNAFCELVDLLLSGERIGLCSGFGGAMTIA